MPDWDCETDYLCEWCDAQIADREDAVSRLYRDQEYLFCCEECAEEAICEWTDEERIGRYTADEDYCVFGDEYANPCNFREPGSGSALRNGPLIHPCPNCGRPNMLSPHDVQLGYQCDYCGDMAERGW